MNVDSPCSGAPLVERREVGQRHVDLAAHLDQRRRVGERQRDRGDRAQVVGHVLADLAVAAGRPALEHAVAVDERDREAVDLRLGDVAEVGVLDPLARQVAAHAGDPGPQLVGRAHVGEREHRLQVADLREPGDGLVADALRRRVRRDQLGVLGLERLQLAEQRVVDVVADLRVVEDVVAVVVVGDLLAQLGDLAARRRSFHLAGRGREQPRQVVGAAASRSRARRSGRSAAA